MCYNKGLHFTCKLICIVGVKLTLDIWLTLLGLYTLHVKCKITWQKSVDTLHVKFRALCDRPRRDKGFGNAKKLKKMRKSLDKSLKLWYNRKWGWRRTLGSRGGKKSVNRFRDFTLFLSTTLHIEVSSGWHMNWHWGCQVLYTLDM